MTEHQKDGETVMGGIDEDQATGGKAVETCGIIKKYLQAHQEHRFFSGSVAVYLGISVIFSESFGMANIEHNVPNRATSRYRIASITKQFTAACILRLREQSLLSVDTRLREYFDDGHPHWEKVTIHHLLTNSSGLYDFDKDATPLNSRMPLSPAEVIDIVKAHPLAFEPGSRYEYCNSGWILLGQIIEMVSGVSFDEFLRANILQPAGMLDSGLDRPSLLLQRRAFGYHVNGLGEVEVAPWEDIGSLAACGGMYSTTLDMVKWYLALQGDKVLTRESRELMFTKHVTRVAPPVSKEGEAPLAENGEEDKGKYYGYGLRAEDCYGVLMLSHSGDIFSGYQSTMRMAFKRHKAEASLERSTYDFGGSFCVAVLANCRQAAVEVIAEAITALIMKGSVPTLPRPVVAVTLPDYSCFEGRYRLLPPYQSHSYLIKAEAGKGGLRLLPILQQSDDRRSIGTSGHDIQKEKVANVSASNAAGSLKAGEWLGEGYLLLAVSPHRFIQLVRPDDEIEFTFSATGEANGYHHLTWGGRGVREL